jgi:hypothetical protein
MKTKIISVLLLVAAIATSSCKKTDTKTVTNTVVTVDTVNAIETPVQTAIALGVLTDTMVEYHDGPYEEGNTFYSSENGVITKLGAIFPNGTFKVSLWDAVQDTLIVSTNVVCTDSTKFFYTAITPVHIIANYPYLLSNNTTTGGSTSSYFSYQNKAITALAYPYSVGSITFVSFSDLSTSTTLFPTFNYADELINSDIVFQADK